MNTFTFDSFVTYFIFFAGGLSLVISLSELFVRVRQFENYIFTALLFSFGMLMFQIGFIINGAIYQHPSLFYFHLTFLYLVGPIGSFAYQLIILPRDTLPVRMYFYLIPTIVAVIYDINFIFSPDEYKKNILETLILNRNTSDIILIRILFLGTALQVIIFLGNLFLKFLSIWNMGNRAKVLVITMGYLIFTITASSMEMSGYFFSSEFLIKTGAFSMAVLFVCTFFVSQRYPKFLQLLIDEAEKKYIGRSLLEGIKINEVCDRLNVLMRNEKIYRDDELTLKKLSHKLAIKPHQLSQLLNERLDTNFNKYVNQFRIDEAKVMLIKEPERSVLSIAYEVGFNSKSSFYDAFSRFTGKVPKEFRRDNIENS